MKFILVSFSFSSSISISKAQNYNILIVGNSLSYYNSLPEIIQTIGKEEEIEINVECLCKPNYALIDHWDDGQLQQLISKGKYDFVVLQQGPSSQDWGKEILIEYGQKISGSSGMTNSKLAFYMVWPSLQYYSTFSGVIHNYSLAAEKTDAIIIPVGKVWREYILDTQDYSIYTDDNFHPSKKGSFLAGITIYMSLIDPNLVEYRSSYSSWINSESFSEIASLSKRFISSK